MPLPHLVLAMEPPAPTRVRDAAGGLYFRDHLTIALVVPEEDGFPDNWIYIHSPKIRCGRIQNFRAWSPEMLPDPDTARGVLRLLRRSPASPARRADKGSHSY